MLVIMYHGFEIENDLSCFKDAPQDTKKEVTVKVGDIREGYHVKDEVGRFVVKNCVTCMALDEKHSTI